MISIYGSANAKKSYSLVQLGVGEWISNTVWKRLYIKYPLHMESGMKTTYPHGLKTKRLVQNSEKVTKWETPEEDWQVQ